MYTAIVIVVILVLIWLYYNKTLEHMGIWPPPPYCCGWEQFTMPKLTNPMFSGTLQRRFGMGFSGEGFSSGNVGAGTVWANVQRPSR
jgi:hypothetical protein